MQKLGWILIAVALCAGCQKRRESDNQRPGPAGGGGGKGMPNSPAQSAEELKAPLAKIDDVTITLGEFQERINRQSPYIRARYTSLEQKKEFLDSLIRFEVLAKEAYKRGLDKDPEVTAQADLAKQTVLVGAYIQDYLKANPVSDDVIKAEYEKLKAQIGSKEYKVRHILVEKESEAKDIIAQLKKGAKFDKLAAEKSKDTGSKVKGGDLNWITPSNVVKPFGDALLKLKKGQFTQEPVESQFGWHIIKLEDERDVKAPSLDEIKPQLAQRLQQEQIQKGIADLRTKAKIEAPEGITPAPADKK